MANEDGMRSNAFAGWQRAALMSLMRIVVFTVAIVGLSSFTAHLGLNQGTYIVVAVLVSLIWLAAYVAYYRWMARRIYRTEHPAILGMEALVVGTVIFLAIFAKAYHLLSLGDPSSFSEPLDLFSSYYFAVTVLSTVGFGDIVPRGAPARSFAMTQMLLDLVIIAIAVRLMTREVKAAAAKRRAAHAPPSSPVRDGDDAASEPGATDAH